MNSQTIIFIVLNSMTLIFPTLALSAAVHVQQINPNFDVSKMKKPGVEVHTVSAPAKEPLPAIKNREAVFAKAGFTEAELKSMDELDRDMLYLRAQQKPANELEKMYPKLKKEKLFELKILASKEKK